MCLCAFVCVWDREAKDKNRESWYMAYIMDTNEEERAKGKTVRCCCAPPPVTLGRYDHPQVLLRCHMLSWTLLRDAVHHTL